MAGGKILNIWEFNKKKKGYEITKQEEDSNPYSLGIAKPTLLNSMVLISHHFQEGDIVKTGNIKEDLIFWHEDLESYVLLPKGFTNNSVIIPKLITGECN